MYYEESVINGVLHMRATPNGEWSPFSAEGLTKMLVEARKKLEDAEIELVVARSFNDPYKD